MSLRPSKPDSGPVVELEFGFDDPEYPFVGASATASCRVELEEMVPRGDGTYAEFYSVSGASPSAIEAMAHDHPSVSATVIERYDDGALMEFLVGGDCPAVGLAELGALPRSVVGDDGDGQIVAELPASYDAGEVVSAFQSEYGGELLAKREREAVTPLFSQRELEQALDEQLTDRQREVLEAAFEAGYYDWPRETDGAALADELGISQPTLSEHLTTAERKLLSLVFER
ncbi:MULTISPECIES: helix-turn-helix domain-containing protein [Halolamina]|uniref:Predicted DNA binding protein, contains HTH domain n=1 Tax=Halolamina pelagica TaxID=699431 RepID=A0A1I5QR60_9EURY|nr:MULTISPECIES: bacterio-opsin activator domain-containing protein [Halolamina]NHX35494.1 helix-turn-helix domain-containing protein [Halolamina sp. R1-12]SFP48521.1 Predicted DNA binding protein, contains HTH domain [Halolamina pelagica]